MKTKQWFENNLLLLVEEETEQIVFDAILYTDWATVWHNKMWLTKQIWVWVYCENPRIEVRHILPGLSNNEAEFEALILWMQTALEMWLRTVLFRTDSLIVVNRALWKKPKKAKFKNERMDKFQDRVLELKKYFDLCHFEWIPREQNMEADRLSKPY